MRGFKGGNLNSLLAGKSPLLFISPGWERHTHTPALPHGGGGWSKGALSKGGGGGGGGVSPLYLNFLQPYSVFSS